MKTINDELRMKAEGKSGSGKWDFLDTMVIALFLAFVGAIIVAAILGEGGL